MSKRPLNPEVVVRALRAFLGLQSELMTRVAAFITQNIPSEPELAENLTRCVPKDDPFQVTQNEIAFAIVRRKIENGTLPESGPTLVIDDFAPNVGNLSTFFVQDLEREDIVPTGTIQRAWDFVPTPGSTYRNALVELFQGVGVPQEVADMTVPFVFAQANQHMLLAWPFPGRPTEGSIGQYAGIVERAEARGEDIFRAMIRETMTPESFRKCLETDIVPVSEQRDREMTGVLTESAGDDPEMLAEVAEIVAAQNMGGFALAVRAYLMQEIEAIWGKDAASSLPM